MVEETRDDEVRTREPEPPSGVGGNGPILDHEANVVHDDIAALQAQMQDASEKYLRLAADFDNYRKRVDRDRADQLTRAQSTLLRRLLEILDDLERVAHHADSKGSAQALAQGVELVQRKFRQLLESVGLEEIQADNARFDPTTMEAVASVSADKPEEDDTVSDVFQKGYRYSGVLLRPARVRVRKFE